MGFVSEELNETEKQLIKGGKAGNMAVVYGKEASIWKVSPWHLPARRGEPRLQDGSPASRTGLPCAAPSTGRRNVPTHRLEKQSLTAPGNTSPAAGNWPPSPPPLSNVLY